MRPVVKRPTTIKLVTLYIMDRYRTPIPESALSNIMLGDIDVNYFDYRESLNMMIEKNYVYSFIEEGHEFLRLTVDGKEWIDEMYQRVAYQLRLEIGDFIKREKKKIIKGKEFQCEIVPTTDVDFNVAVTYREADEPLFHISFKGGTRQTATHIAETIRARKELFYRELNLAVSNTLDAPPEEN